MRPARAGASLALAAGVLVTGCGDPTTEARAGERVSVAASFYPLQWVTEQVAGSRARVTSLTPPGAEPHDLELGPRQVAAIAEADLVVYLESFQPAVDEAIEQEAGDSSLDVSRAARLVAAPGTADAPGQAEPGEDHADEDGRGGPDPHFWLDPTRLADVADAVASRLARIDRAGARGYADRAEAVRAELAELDAQLQDGLAGCAGTDLVTSHTAFGYLAERYGMRQVGLTGLAPEAEPSPRDLAAVAAFVRQRGVRTIYYETLVAPDVAETVARETGARTAVLDPLEGLTDESPGTDYLSVMLANMATLQEGQPCPSASP